MRGKWQAVILRLIASVAVAPARAALVTLVRRRHKRKYDCYCCCCYYCKYYSCFPLGSGGAKPQVAASRWGWKPAGG